MVRGGKREKAGRKSTWSSGCRFEDTKLIRVPAAIADQLLDVAHKIDAGEPVETSVESTEINEARLPLTEQLSLLGENQERLVKVPLAIEDAVRKYIEKLSFSLDAGMIPRNQFSLFCPVCHSDDICKHGFAGKGEFRKQVYKCKTCGRRFSP